MSEEILKALAQLFAIISKQGGGVTEKERRFVIDYFRNELDTKTLEEYIELYDKFSSTNGKQESNKDRKGLKKMTNVLDSVRTLKLCRQINKTLSQKQKFIVLVKLLEIVNSDRNFTPQRMEIINTVSDVFNIPSEEYKLLENFVIQTHSSNIDHEDILIFDDERPPENSKIKFIDSGFLDGEIIFVRAKSVGLYFTKYTGEDEITLNNIQVKKNSIKQFSPGSIFKTPKGSPLYYSDLVATYNQDRDLNNISFNADNLEYIFLNGTIAIRDINLSEGPGNLIGIMGASGAGKTTLLNILAGLELPSKGKVTINNYDIHTQKEKIEGVIGYIAQDDLLIEELTVYQNLYYNAKLCFKDLSRKELHDKIMKVLTNLGLERIHGLRVGSIFNKKISGGQRKRLNIALELIREPVIMFVDEPTSGLSSRDSENVVDLLKELSLKGKLVFVVIHQPSSDIFKMFDKILVMDTGGYPIFYGDPIESIIYFKVAANQIGKQQGQCMTCGNVNPEQIFGIVESKVVDEFGEFTNKRKITPQEWHKIYMKRTKLEKIEGIQEDPPRSLRIPSIFRQTIIFTARDFFSKASNIQYILINLVEAPLLALLLSLVIRYKSESTQEYTYRYNDNIPAFILMCIVISLFMGLTVSAEEIIHDRKILKREAFLNLSKLSYMTSKVIILFLLSATQTLAYVWIGNSILEIKGAHFMYWLVLFTVSCHANILGLNISSAFNSAVTVYILIPLLLIPQLILSGLIFNYDKLNDIISKPGKVPLLADLMASRWAYESLAVGQFKKNRYYAPLFDMEMHKSQYNYKNTYWIPKLEEIIDEAALQLIAAKKDDSVQKLLNEKIRFIQSEFRKDEYIKNHSNLNINQLVTGYDTGNISMLKEQISKMREHYESLFRKENDSFDSLLYAMKNKLPENTQLFNIQNQYYNDKLADVVKNTDSEDPIKLTDKGIVQIINPIFSKPENPSHKLDYRTHFYSPEKHLFGMYFDTYYFNVVVIWIMNALLFLTLYYEFLSKAIQKFSLLTHKFILIRGNKI